MRFKKFDEFVNESYSPTNESIKDVLQKVGNFFKGKGAWLLNFVKNTKKPKGFVMYPSKEDIATAKSVGITLTAPAVSKPAEKTDAPKGIKLKRPFLFLTEGEEMGTDYLIINEAVAKTELDITEDIEDVDLDSLREILNSAVKSGADHPPVLVWGAPGIGKTAITYSIIDKADHKTILDFPLLNMGPEDFALPATVGDTAEDIKYVSLVHPMLPLRKASAKEIEGDIDGDNGGILLFDEIARCREDVQKVCLKLTQERKIGDYTLGKKWAIILLANRRSDLTSDEQESFHWNPTFANRMLQVNYSPDINRWTRDFADTAVDAAGELIVDPKMVAFLKFNEKYFHLLDVEKFSGGSVGSAAWPSPRSWENAAKSINQFRKNNEGQISQKMLKTLLRSAVGTEASSAYVGFLNLMDRLNPQDIENVWIAPEKAPSLDTLKDQGEKHAMISAVCYKKKRQKELTDKEMLNFVTWLIKAKNAFNVPNAIKAINMLYGVFPTLKTNDYWEDTCKNKLVDAYPTIFDED